MKFPAFKLSFAFKLTSFLLAVSMLPLLIFQLVSYDATRRAIMDEAIQHNQLLLSNQRDYLNLQMEQINGLATNLESVEEINRALVELGEEGQAESTYDQLATKARIGYVLSGYSSLRGLVSIDLFTMNGRQYHVGDTLNLSNVRTGLRDKLMQKTIEAGNRLIWHGVEDNVNSASGSRKVIVATKLLGGHEGRAGPAGMLLINFSTDYLHNYFSRINLGEGAYLMIVDENGRLLFHPSKKLIGQPIEDGLGRMLKEPSGSLPVILDGRDTIVSYLQMPDKQWKVISVVPYDTLMSPMNNINRIVMVLLIVNLLLIAWFIRTYLQQVVSPIRAISEGFERFQGGRVDGQWRLPKPRTLDEISELVDWFNSFLETNEANRQAQVSLRIAATAFEAQEGMIITDADTMILRVNRAFCEITGYSTEEAVGQKMGLLRSDRHDAAFFTAMWEAIKRDGSWQGEIWNKRKNGEIFPAWLTITSVKNEQGEVSHYVGTMTDIATRKAAEAEIAHLAFYDALTQLPNRRLLNDRLSRAMSSSKRSGRYCALMFLDLDRFKPLNDTYGHDVGDLLLVEVARRISACVREMDTVARFGGDEFVVMLSELDVEHGSSLHQAMSVAEKIRMALSAPYFIEVQRNGEQTIIEHNCTSSIGLVLFIGHESSAEDTLKWADIAMYRAKEAGRNTIQFYEINGQ